MFSLCAIVFRFVLSTDNAKKKKINITLRPNTGFNNSTSTPSADDRCIRCYAARRSHRCDK